MRSEPRKLIQVVLVVAIAAAGVRLLLIYRARHNGQAAAPATRELPLNADYYVTPKKLYAYDLKSARELTQRPVWVREGYRYTYYSYDSGTHHADFRRPAGLLGPIEKLEIADVVLDRPPSEPLKAGEVRVNPNEQQVMAVFRKDGRTYAVPIGLENKGDYRIYADEIFYIQDPRELYKHWPSDVWQAIERHEVKPGMNELQASFAIGMGIPQPINGGAKTVRYPNGGHPVQIIYRDGYATEIKPQA